MCSKSTITPFTLISKEFISRYVFQYFRGNYFRIKKEISFPCWMSWGYRHILWPKNISVRFRFDNNQTAIYDTSNAIFSTKYFRQFHCLLISYYNTLNSTTRSFIYNRPYIECLYKNKINLYISGVVCG